MSVFVALFGVDLVVTMLRLVIYAVEYYFGRLSVSSAGRGAMRCDATRRDATRVSSLMVIGNCARSNFVCKRD